MLSIARRLIAVVFLAACAGADGAAGPPGPAGPQGPPGPAGSANFFSSTGVLSGSGSVTVPLPAVPANARPVLSCYITDQITQPVAWLKVSDGRSTSSSTSVCGLVLANNQWNAVMINSPAFWYYFVAVIW